MRRGVGFLCAVFAATVAGFFASAAPVHAAEGQLSGGSGTSANLSANPTIRHDQLIVDPNPGSGSLTVLYDPSVVSLYSIFNAPNFEIDANNTYVGVVYNSTDYLATGQNYFNNAGKVSQSGRVQVAWTPVGNVMGGTNFIGNAPTDPSDYTTVGSAAAGDGGVDTFGLEFKYLPTNNTTLATFTVEADAGGRATINLNNFNTNLPPTPADFLTDPNDPNGTAIPFSQIAPATVSGPLVPEPTALVLFAAGGLSIAAWKYRGALLACFT